MSEVPAISVQDYLRFVADQIDQAVNDGNQSEFFRLLDALIQALQDLKVKYENKIFQGGK